MQHAAVVSRLMRSELALFFEKSEPEIASSKQELVRRGQADDSAADDDEVESLCHDAGKGIPNFCASEESEL